MELILEANLPMYVSLSLDHSFCLNKKPRVKKLLSHPRRLEEQRERMRTYAQLKAWEEIAISSDDEEELTRQTNVLRASGPSTSKPGRTS